MSSTFEERQQLSDQLAATVAQLVAAFLPVTGMLSRLSAQLEELERLVVGEAMNTDCPCTPWLVCAWHAETRPRGCACHGPRHPKTSCRWATHRAAALAAGDDAD